jgi:ribosomal protein S18 acetylase RimI-like enzyme
LAVVKGYRRQGIARLLVQEAETRLRAQGAHRVDALVESDHPLAISFWSASDYTLRQNMLRYYKDLYHE